MGFERITVTVSGDLLRELDKIAKEREEDRSVALRQILSAGINEIRIKDALEAYAAGKVSLEKAAETAGVSLWRILELLRERKTPLKYSAEEAEREIRTIFGRQAAH